MQGKKFLWPLGGGGLKVGPLRKELFLRLPKYDDAKFIFFSRPFFSPSYSIESANNPFSLNGQKCKQLDSGWQGRIYGGGVVIGQPDLNQNKGILYFRGIIFFPNQIQSNSAILNFFTGALQYGGNSLLSNFPIFIPLYSLKLFFLVLTPIPLNDGQLHPCLLSIGCPSDFRGTPNTAKVEWEF